MPKFQNLQEAMQAWLDGDDFPPAPAAVVAKPKEVIVLAQSFMKAYSEAPRRIA